MIRLLHHKGVLWPLLLSFLGLIILIQLGNWQMHRKEWKAELKALVNERIKADPIAFNELKEKAAQGEDIRFQPVRVSGVFDHQNERHYFLPLGSKIGWHIITPMKTADGDVVLIDRGFVPDELKDQKTRIAGLPAGEVTIVGLARDAEVPNYFTPSNDVEHNKWYWRDIAGLYKSLAAGNEAGLVPALNFMIDERRVGSEGEWPMPGVTVVKFQDKHLGYALTWYGLALTLIGVFSAFAYSRLRSVKG